MKNCVSCDPSIHEGGCNWLDWMVEDAGGVCPHCGGVVTEITTVTALGATLDRREVATLLPWKEGCEPR
jgi:hypothetical protein